MAAGACNDERLAFFAEGVRLCLSRWTALQLAVDNQWGGRNSFQKAEQLVNDVVNLVTRSKDLYIDDVENLLEESLLVAFNTEIDDGSIEEVAEIVMHLDQECKAGNFDRVRQLAAAPSGAKQSVCENQKVLFTFFRLLNVDFVDSQENEEESEGDEAEEMSVDKKSDAGTSSKDVPENRKNDQAPMALSAQEVAEGWELVKPRRKR